jgi:hypothetical protein
MITESPVDSIAILDCHKTGYNGSIKAIVYRSRILSNVKPLPESDLEDFVHIVANSYPAMEINSGEERDRSKQLLKSTYEEPARCIYGLYRQGKLLGGMILIDFTMNYRGTMIPAGGVGLVAVDLLHKKEKVAQDMMVYFLNHYSQKKTPLLMLYPFRPDFYKNMGFGYGTKVNQ